MHKGTQVGSAVARGLPCHSTHSSFTAHGSAVSRGGSLTFSEPWSPYVRNGEKTFVSQDSCKDHAQGGRQGLSHEVRTGQQVSLLPSAPQGAWKQALHLPWVPPCCRLCWP